MPGKGPSVEDSLAPPSQESGWEQGPEWCRSSSLWPWLCAHFWLAPSHTHRGHCPVPLSLPTKQVEGRAGFAVSSMRCSSLGHMLRLIHAATGNWYV
jgi:hypothetical protein